MIQHLQQIQGSSEPEVRLEAAKQIKIWSRTEWLAEQQQQRQQQTDPPLADATQEDQPEEDTENKAASLRAEIQSAAEEVRTCLGCTWYSCAVMQVWLPAPGPQNDMLTLAELEQLAEVQSCRGAEASCCAHAGCQNPFHF